MKLFIRIDTDDRRIITTDHEIPIDLLVGAINPMDIVETTLTAMIKAIMVRARNPRI